MTFKLIKNMKSTSTLMNFKSNYSNNKSSNHIVARMRKVKKNSSFRYKHSFSDILWSYEKFLSHVDNP